MKRKCLKPLLGIAKPLCISQKPNKLLNLEKELNIKLYHGTSTLFLDSILENGLAKINPVKNWKIIELSKEIYKLCKTHIPENKSFLVKSYSFNKMIEQSNNFQHGQTYLSPSKHTAIRYAISNDYGSEILSYTIFLLKLLLNLEIELDYISKDLFKKFPEIFGLIEARPSPVLIEIRNVNKSALLSENGNDPQDNFKYINDYKNETPEMFDALTQQINFRLTSHIDPSNLKYWLINITKRNGLNSEYNLYELTK